MAHVGQRYPLHFRRDLSPNVTNRFGFANIYSHAMIGRFNQPLIDPTQPAPWYSSVGDDSGPELIKWIGVPFAFGGHTWDWMLSLEGQGHDNIPLPLISRIRRDGVSFRIDIYTVSTLSDFGTLFQFGAGWQTILNQNVAPNGPAGLLQPVKAKPWH